MPQLKFLDKTLHGLKPPVKGQAEWWDTVMPGFGMKIGSGGRKSFQVLTRIDGRVRRFTLKPAFPILTLAKARDQARKIIADAHSGIDPEAAEKAALQTAKKHARNTFGAVAADFMADHAKNLRTRGEMQRKLDVELLPHWGDRPIAGISRADVKALLREKARSGGIAANRLLALISKIFTWALDEEIIGASPAVRLPRLGEEHERERTLEPDEIKAAWEAFERAGYPFGPLFKMMLVTGQRRGEVAGMRWSEIGPDGWKLPLARAKTKKGHLVPLSSLAREILASVPQVGEHVFRSYDDKPLQGWSKAKKRIGGDWRLHDLRRTMATQMRSISIDRLVVSKILNHAEVGVTKVYDRYAADPEKAAAMERWANRLREIISGATSPKVVAFGARP
jgi:integrase